MTETKKSSKHLNFVITYYEFSRLKDYFSHQKEIKYSKSSEFFFADRKKSARLSDQKEINKSLQDSINSFLSSR